MVGIFDAELTGLSDFLSKVAKHSITSATSSSENLSGKVMLPNDIGLGEAVGRGWGTHSFRKSSRQQSQSCNDIKRVKSLWE